MSSPRNRLWALFLLLFPSVAFSQSVQLFADTNRDGLVSPVSDNAGKAAFSDTRGAVVVPNNDDDNDDGEPDHSDSSVNGISDAADLAPLLIPAISNLPLGTDLTISVDAGSSAFVRLYLQTSPNTFTALTSGASGNIPGSAVRAGAQELRLEANSHPTASWNGRITVTLTATNATGLSQATDSVLFQTAPFLLSPGTAPATELYVRAMTNRNETFVSQLQALAPTVGITIRVSPASAPYQYNDCWMQDAMEPGYTQAGNQWRNVVLRANRGTGWLLSNFAKDELLAPNYGWISVSSYRSTFAGGSAPNGWLDWFGNLEVTPALPGWPRGRIYYGANGANSLDPAIVAFLNAQSIQGPAVALDTGWLLIKHVDEMICWVPSGNPSRPYKMLVPDTTLMATMLDSWVTAGYGALPLLQPYFSSLTVSSMANSTTRRNFNATLQSTRINPMIEAAKTGFGLTEADVIRVPAWYNTDGSSYVPCMVNAALANGHLLVSDPFGPRVSGIDLIQQDLQNRLSSLPLTIHFLDDRQYHLWSGNVHCATNLRRTPDVAPVYPQDGARVPDWSTYEADPQ
jgi:protein-arginine deiminase